ncbi:MAG: mRNA-degrading endonuclease, partial [Okeania sp. SIO3B3]|nr:mRNA-degrading endonuclease [Okeania sp. SIO3B3]
VRLALVCPITSKAKNYSLEVAIPEGLEISGVILIDHIKSLDWRSRKAEFICEIPSDVLVEVVSKLTEIISGILS